MEKTIQRNQTNGGAFSDDLVLQTNTFGFSKERLMASASGDIRQHVHTEVGKILSEKKNNVLDALKNAVKRLKEDGFITESDVKTLNQVCFLIVAFKNKKKTFEEAFSEIEQILAEMKFDKNVSPTALAIVESVNYLRHKKFEEKGGSNSRALSIPISDGAALGGIAGGLIGAGIGGAFGGPLGSVIGGAIGGAIGAIVGACAD